MDIVTAFNRIPIHQHFGIELTDAGDGRAEGRLAHSEDIVSSPTGEVIHGGATYTLADTVGGIAVGTLARGVTPTIDMRMDYLAPAMTDLHCEAEVARYGGSVATVDVDVHDAEGTHVASAHGTYKTGGQGEKTAWEHDAQMKAAMDREAGGE